MLRVYKHSLQGDDEILDIIDWLLEGLSLALNTLTEILGNEINTRRYCTLSGSLDQLKYNIRFSILFLAILQDTSYQWLAAKRLFKYILVRQSTSRKHHRAPVDCPEAVAVFCSEGTRTPNVWASWLSICDNEATCSSANHVTLGLGSSWYSLSTGNVSKLSSLILNLM